MYKNSNPSVHLPDLPEPEERAAPALNINGDTKHFTDYFSFPPITLIDDLEIWDDEEDSV